VKALVIANWKMNPKTYREARQLLDATKKIAESSPGVSLVVCPPAIFARELFKGYKGKIALGLQSVNALAEGAQTGEISIPQAKDTHASYCLIGHAERRAMGETAVDTTGKVKAALLSKMTPVLCVGEKERSKSGEYLAFVREQLRIGLAEAPQALLKKLVIAYEPVWAIGAKVPMSARDMHEMSIFIRKTIHESHGEAAHAVKIIYGGSIDENTAVPMLREGDVDGLLPGRISIDVPRFKLMLQAISQA
jgi:triosephosphate isomerase (TIM)